MFTKTNAQIANGDLEPNNTLENCKKNIQFKIKGKDTLTAANLSKLPHEDIIAIKIEGRDLMQWSLINNDKENVELLSKHFKISDYADYLKTFSLDTQKNMQALFSQNVSKNSKK